MYSTNVKSEISLTFITSLYNESIGFRDVVNYIRLLNNYFSKTCEFIVIDNNSVDGVYAKLTKEFENEQNIKMYRLTNTKNYSEAIKFGLSVSSNNHIVIFPSDLQHPVEDCLLIAKKYLEKYLGGTNIAIFAKRVRLDGPTLKIRGLIWRRLIKFIIPELLTDPTSQLKAFTYNEVIVPKTVSHLVFDIEFQFLFLKYNYDCFEINSIFIPRKFGVSKFTFRIKTVTEALTEISNLRSIA